MLENKGYTNKQLMSVYLAEPVTVDVSSFIMAAQQYVDNYTQRDFKEIAEAEYEANLEKKLFDGNGRPDMVIPQAVFINEIKVDGAEYPFLTLPYNESPKYKVILKDGNYFLRGQANVEIEAVWGYGYTPSDIKMATTMIACNLYNSDRNGAVGSEKIGDYSISYINDKDKKDFEKAKQMLDKYKTLC